MIGGKPALPGPYIHMSWMRHAAQRLAKGYHPKKSGRATSPKAACVDHAELSQLLLEHPNYPLSAPLAGPVLLSGTTSGTK